MGAGHVFLTSTDLGRVALPLNSLTHHGDLLFVGSQRNTPALFGAGLIDAIPDQRLLDAAAKKHPGFNGVTGRVSRLADGSIGRFGWKAQTATLHDFVLNACATEMGLHVPGRSQLASPTDPNYQPPGYDLDEDECRAMTDYLRQLKHPRRTTGEANLSENTQARSVYESSPHVLLNNPPSAPHALRGRLPRGLKHGPQ